MGDCLAILICFMKCIYPRALQLMFRNQRSSGSKALLESWSALVSNPIIMFVEAANLVEVLVRMPLFYEDTTLDTEPYDLTCCVAGVTTAFVVMIISVSLKSRSALQGLIFPLCRVERYPEVIGFLWLQVQVSFSTQSTITALISSLIIWYAACIIIIKEEAKNAIKYRESYLEFWNRSQSNLPLVDGALELVFRLKGLTPAKKRSRNSIIKAWPSIFYG